MVNADHPTRALLCHLEPRQRLHGIPLLCLLFSHGQGDPGEKVVMSVAKSMGAQKG